MKIGILVCSPLTNELQARFGTMASMFETLLSSQNEHLVFESFDVFEDALPTHVQQCDGWLITGSRHSAYEDLPWILRLKAFVRDAMNQDVPMIGVCFGHQLMAAALGGVVQREKSGRWGMAVQTYDIPLNGEERPDWMTGNSASISLQASHQDQVTTLPPNAKRLGGNEFCPNGIIVYSNSGMSLQLHPELSGSFIQHLLENRRGEAMSIADADEAMTRINLPVDASIAAQWMIRFFEQRH